MNKYIDAEKLIAEIERLKEETPIGICEYDKGEENGRYEALNQLLSTITSLRQKQPKLPGIEDPGIPGKDFIPVEWVDACEMYGKWKIVKLEQPEVDLEKEIDAVWNPRFNLGWDEKSLLSINRSAFETIARHFYEIGLNARKEE